MVLEKTPESPLDCKEIQPVHSKEISPGCSLKGMMLKLKLQYFGYLMRRVDSLEKTVMLGWIGAGGEGLRNRSDVSYEKELPKVDFDKIRSTIEELNLKRQQKYVK